VVATIGQSPYQFEWYYIPWGYAMPKGQDIAAAIDLGSNSFRLLIGLRDELGQRNLHKQRAKVRLARGLSKS
jgi:hypothetical protein